MSELPPPAAVEHRPGPAPFEPHAPAPYHRLLRTLPDYAWWRPLVALLLTVLFLIPASVIVGGIVVGIGIGTGDIRLDTVQTLEDDLYGLAVLDAAKPVGLLLALLSLAVLLPCVQLALLCVGIRPTTVRHSVAFRLRWRWMLLMLGPAALIFGLNIALSSGISALAGEAPFLAPTTDLGLFLVCAAIIVVFTPFQAAAEEYIFRGLLAQMLGGWIRYLPVSIILSTLAFAALHAYDFWGLVDVFIFGLAASLVVWRTGGLEAGIALHSVNNVGAFLILASGVAGTTVNESETAGPIGPALSIVTMGLWVLWMSWLARRAGIQRLGAWTPEIGPPRLAARVAAQAEYAAWEAAAAQAAQAQAAQTQAAPAQPAPAQPAPAQAAPPAVGNAGATPPAPPAAPEPPAGAAGSS